uniref:Uncharacterized protein n=1 Tax=Lepeophtheirus salmonis TaxID=72036 RepID=A0A0K2V573_LEPSM
MTRIHEYVINVSNVLNSSVFRCFVTTSVHGFGRKLFGTWWKRPVIFLTIRLSMA